MQERLADFGDIEVVLVMFSDPAAVAGYDSRHHFPFPILIDRDRDVYRAFGLGRGSVARVWGWKMARRYIEIFRTDGVSGLHRPTEDTLQLGGDFVVAGDGTLAYGFWSDGPDDRPSVDELIDAVQRTSSDS